MNLRIRVSAKLTRELELSNFREGLMERKLLLLDLIVLIHRTRVGTIGAQIDESQS